MGYVPKDVKWFIAEIVEEITVEGDPRNVVHVNFNLIRAESPEEAYTKAIELGRGGETEYRNADGKLVHIRFHGLRDLNVIYDDLEDGAELMFEKRVSVPSDELQTLIRPKEELDVFSGWKPPDLTKEPDYSSKEVLDEVERRFGAKRFQGTGNGPDDH
jgi:uncharacterized protein DUF4288